MQMTGADVVDEQRFERVWRAYGSSLLRFCRFATGSHEDGDDAAAETLTRFLERGERIPDESVEAWLFTVARNLIISRQRRIARFRLLAPRIARSEVSERVDDDTSILLLLRPSERLAVYLRVVEDRPFAEVATLMNVSEGAAKKKVYRGLERLRREYPEPGSLERRCEA